MTDEQKQRNIRLAEALESGKYRQIKEELRNECGYCCLGVACEIAKEPLGLGWRQLKNEDGDEEPSEDVMRYYGWARVNPAIEINGRSEMASVHNDSRGATFDMIAKGFRRLAGEIDPIAPIRKPETT